MENDLNLHFGHIRNEYLDRIEPFIGKDIIKVLVGMRRSGKSFLLRQIIHHLITEKGVLEKDILYIDKESIEFHFLKNHLDTHHYVQSKAPKYVLIDEVQEIEKWEKLVASLQKGGIDVYISGSNAHMLSSDLATYIAGRYIQFPIYTLSYREFVTFNNLPGFTKGTFLEYLKLGGFPALLQFKGDPQSSYELIKDIFKTIVLKDIVARHGVRNVPLLDNIILFIADNIGNTFSAKTIADYLKSQRLSIGNDTVYMYIRYLIDTFSVHLVKRYDIQGKRHLEISEKYYLGDLGIRHALLNYRERDMNAFLENVVYLELLRQGYEVSIGKEGSREVDFIAEKFGQRVYIQVAYLLATKEVRDREFNVLKDIRDNFPKLVLSMDEHCGVESDEGILRINIVDFLADPKKYLSQEFF